MAITNAAAGMSDPTSNILTGIAGYLGNRASTNANVAGANDAIGTQQSLEQQLASIYGPQTGAGNGAAGGLDSVLGLNGAPANYSDFMNSPGFQSSLQLGTQAINRQAAASGMSYTPNTLDAVGNYTTTMADQNYNNYVNQLLGTAGIGAQNNANYGKNLSDAATNISQAQIGSGAAKASGANNSINSLGTLAGGVINALGGVGKIASGIGSIFGGGSSSSPVGNSNLGDTSGLGSNAWNTSGFDPNNLGTLSGLDSLGTGASTDNFGLSGGFSNLDSGFNSSDYSTGFSV